MLMMMHLTSEANSDMTVSLSATTSSLDPGARTPEVLELELTLSKFWKDVSSILIISLVMTS